ncbi:unnamed protein product [Effrenium voratum]|nr:unnamed protein product [Effrenium voratum]
MDALKSLIRDRLRGNPTAARLLEERPELQEDPAALLGLLEEQGVIEEIYAQLECSLQKPLEPSPVVQPAPDARFEAGDGPAPGWQLCLRLVEGQAFLDYLEDADSAGREMVWHLAFGRQRWRSRAVPCAVAPRFDEAMFLKLPSCASRNGLLQHSSPVHLVLVSYGGSGSGEEPPWDVGQGTVISSHLLEWRHCLSTPGPLKMTVELQGVGRRHQLSVGVLHLELELRPQGGELLPQMAVAAQLRAEEQRRAEVMRRAFEEMDRWWAEHHMLYPSRHIRLFAQTECCVFLPVANFVVPLHAGRQLDGPSHALRFVSLIPLEPVSAKEASSAEPRWHTFPTLWARGSATCEERALLLCSLLLGYSLDAWCCLGTDERNQAHAWVLVRDKGDKSMPAQVTLWDPRTAAKIRADEPRYLSSFSSVDTVFNHRRVLVCHQEDLAQVSYDFSDPRSWLPAPLEQEVLDVLQLYPCKSCPGFAELSLRTWKVHWDLETLEETIEERLAVALRNHREALGLKTVMDQHVAELLHVALVNLESERRGMPSQASVFEALAGRVCRPGEVLRATPVQFNHLRVSLFWPALSDRPTVREVLAQAAHSFAVRCRVVLLPEGAKSVWAPPARFVGVCAIPGKEHRALQV